MSNLSNYLFYKGFRIICINAIIRRGGREFSKARLGKEGKVTTVLTRDRSWIDPARIIANFEFFDANGKPIFYYTDDVGY
jgi:hypothetical protein